MMIQNGDVCVGAYGGLVSMPEILLLALAPPSRIQAILLKIIMVSMLPDVSRAREMMLSCLSRGSKVKDNHQDVEGGS
eukprot:scaffold6820_cov216-Skeletonema_menzelii.AAC.2